MAYSPDVQTWLDYYKTNPDTRSIPEAQLVPYAESFVRQNKLPPAPGTPISASPVQLSGGDKDARDILIGELNRWGLGELVDDFESYIQRGYSPAQADLELRKTEPFKKRFAGNEMLTKAGFNALSIGEYLSVENEMRNQLKYMPKQFSSTEELAKLIGGRLAPNEVGRRVKAAEDFVTQTPQSVRDEYLRMYGVNSNDIAAALLNPVLAEPVINDRIRKATITGAAKDQGVSTSLTEQIASATPDITYTEAAQGFAQAQELGTRGQALSQIYGDQYGIEEATKETFGLAGAAQAEKTKKKLASKERAAFSGSTGIRAGSLAQDKRSL